MSSNLTFPVTPVIGDNEEVDIDLYNYLIAVLLEDIIVYCPSDKYSIDEIIIHGFGNAELLKLIRVNGTIKTLLYQIQKCRKKRLHPFYEVIDV